MNSYELTLYFIINALGIESIRRIMKALLGAPRNRPFCAVSYLIFLITTVFTHSINSIFISVIVNAITISFISYQYSEVAKRKVYAAALSFVLIYICEMVSGLTFSGKLDACIISYGSPDLAALITSKLLLFSIVLFICRLKKKHNGLSAPIELSAIMLIPVSTAALEVIVIRFVQSMPVIIMSVIMIIILNIIVFALYDNLEKNYIRKIELSNAEQEKEIYYNQCKTIMHANESLKQFRHDINNQLQTINILLDNGNLSELKNHIDNLMSEKSEVTSYYTGNIVVDGLLSYKLEKMKACGATIETSLEIPQQPFMNSKDMTIILGNLLDNSLDAIRLMKKEKYCFIQMKYSKSCLLICIRNTYENSIEVKDGDIISSKNRSDAHGIGLSSIKSIVDKYNGHFDISYNEQFFTAKVILMLCSVDE